MGGSEPYGRRGRRREHGRQGAQRRDAGARHQQPRAAARWRPAASAATSPRTSPGWAPAPTWSPRRPRPRSATSCSPAPRAAGVRRRARTPQRRAHRHLHRRARRRRRAGGRRSPTWRATDELGPEQVDAARDLIAGAALLVLDGNLATATLDTRSTWPPPAGVPQVLDPVSVPKAAALAAADLRGPAALRGHPQPRRARRPHRPPGRRRPPARRRPPPHLHDRGVELVWVRARRARLAAQHGPGGHRAPRRAPDRGRGRDRRRRRDARRLLPRACWRGDDAGRRGPAYGHAAAALTIASPHTVRPDLTDAPRAGRAATPQRAS